MISDRQLHLSLTKAFAWLLWIKVVVDLVLAVILHHDQLAYFGLASSAAACTVHMRSFFVEFSARMQDAFDLGRKVEREQHQTRELHSIH